MGKFCLHGIEQDWIQGNCTYLGLSSIETDMQSKMSGGLITSPDNKIVQYHITLHICHGLKWHGLDKAFLEREKKERKRKESIDKQEKHLIYLCIDMFCFKFFSY